MALVASTCAAFSGLPASSEIVRATSSWRFPRAPATLTRISARLWAGRGSAIALSAASIAARVSSAPALVTRPTTSPEYGERTSSQSPVSTHSPPISSFRSVAVAAMVGGYVRGGPRRQLCAEWRRLDRLPGSGRRAGGPRLPSFPREHLHTLAGEGLRRIRPAPRERPASDHRQLARRRPVGPPARLHGRVAYGRHPRRHGRARERATRSGRGRGAGRDLRPVRRFLPRSSG